MNKIYTFRSIVLVMFAWMAFVTTQANACDTCGCKAGSAKKGATAAEGSAKKGVTKTTGSAKKATGATKEAGAKAVNAAHDHAGHEHAGHSHDSAASKDMPKVIAVKFHADYCGSCKAMSPALKETQAKLGESNVLFVKFDLTNAQTKKQSAMMANMLGLGDVWKKNSGKSGKVVLVDAKTKKELNTITKADDSKSMTKKIKTSMK